MQKNLSLIIPVYNTAKYLRRCLTSVVNQTCFDKLEVIIVNDGSTDNSQEIIEIFTSKFENIISVTKSNGGLSDARNAGVNLANGEYLAFLDSDDWVEDSLYELCINYLDSHPDIELLCFNYCEDWVGFSRVMKPSDKLHRSKYYIGCVAWNKIYSRNFWNTHKFEFLKDIKYEDLELIPKILTYTNNIEMLDNNYYLHYNRTNESSITNSKRDADSLITVFNSLVEFNKVTNDILLTRYIATTFFFQLVLFGGNPRISWGVYMANKSLFNYKNVDSIYSRKILLLESFGLGLLIKILIVGLYLFKINPNKI